MKTLFNFLKMGGGRIIFCSFLSLFMGDLNSQSTPVTFTGNSLFRNYNFGVKNHCFTVQNRIDNYGPTTPVTDCTSSCPSSYGGEFDASDASNGNDNDLSVHPYSACDFDDYINGVTIGDAAVILKHVNDEEYITDPYKMVAADCNHNNEIDEDDVEQIEDLIGEDLLFTRNSWEWFNQKEIIDNYGSFQSDPYSWTISDRYSGYIFWLNVSTSTLTSGTTQPQFFYYTCTKVGDVHNQSNPNDWVCGTYSLVGDNDEAHQIKSKDAEVFNTIFKPKTSFKLYFKCEKQQGGVAYFQMPLKINYDFLRIKNVHMSSNMSIKYKEKVSNNEFIAYALNRDAFQQKESHFDGDLITLEIEVIQEVRKLDEVISINRKWQIEAGNPDLENLIPYVEIGDIAYPKDLYVLCADRLYYSGIESKPVEIQTFNLSGQLVYSKKLWITPGYNDDAILKSTSGISFIRILDIEKTHLIKMVK
ncbi:MAG: hypothetical protein IPM92_00795 [Saprospiraceae bacterium]|nr:hypothetical protein [Saprospiraceae bacterium]